MRPALVFPVLAFAASIALPAQSQPRVEPPAYVVTVDGRSIGVAEYEQALAAAVRARYYHRAPPDGEMATVRREVADSLIELVLVSAEAKRRGIAPDAAKVDKDLERIEARFRAMPGWGEHRGPQVARWRADLEERSLAESLERQVRAEISPTSGQVRDFYQANPALFTEPEKAHLGVILLKVDPSAGKAARDRAREEAAGIRLRLAKGADFAELARIHSGDDSAAKGGDLGFVHRGAVPESVQTAAEKLDAGGISDPIDVLEGIAIVRVTDRKPAQLRPYEAVADRARELLRRQAADKSWKGFVAKLRAGAKIQIDTKHFPGLAAVTDTGKTSATSPR